jgi:hypothetical protein
MSYGLVYNYIIENIRPGEKRVVEGCGHLPDTYAWRATYIYIRRDPTYSKAF